MTPNPPRRRRESARAASRARPSRRPAAGESGHAGPDVRAAGVAIVTVSDTRGPRDDVSGDTAQRLVEGSGHRVVLRRWVPDDRAAIRRVGTAALRRSDVDVVIVTGGTGAAPRDVTPEALEPLLTKPLPGFGERFRARSEADVGTAAWLSRAAAGVARGRLLVMLPGSPRGVALALQHVLLPELGHVLRLIGRVTSGD